MDERNERVKYCNQERALNLRRRVSENNGKSREGETARNFRWWERAVPRRISTERSLWSSASRCIFFDRASKSWNNISTRIATVTLWLRYKKVVRGFHFLLKRKPRHVASVTWPLFFASTLFFLDTASCPCHVTAMSFLRDIALPITVWTTCMVLMSILACRLCPTSSYNF
jgi:hypothetical protein